MREMNAVEFPGRHRTTWNNLQISVHTAFGNQILLFN